MYELPSLPPTAELSSQHIRACCRVASESQAATRGPWPDTARPNCQWQPCRVCCRSHRDTALLGSDAAFRLSWATQPAPKFPAVIRDAAQQSTSKHPWPSHPGSSGVIIHMLHVVLHCMFGGLGNLGAVFWGQAPRISDTVERLRMHRGVRVPGTGDSLMDGVSM